MQVSSVLCTNVLLNTNGIDKVRILGARQKRKANVTTLPSFGECDDYVQAVSRNKELRNSDSILPLWPKRECRIAGFDLQHRSRAVQLVYLKHLLARRAYNHFASPRFFNLGHPVRTFLDVASKSNSARTSLEITQLYSFGH